ncbi:hypothetical protein GCM10009602_68030 [Nocardiopsis tropica]
MRAVCAGFETELVEFNGEGDRVHLLVGLPPKVAVSKLVNSLKGGVLASDGPGVLRAGVPLLASRTPVVGVVLRRVGGRRADQCPASVHRGPETPVPRDGRVFGSDSAAA